MARKVYVDNVYLGRTKKEAINGGLFHLNCRHRATTYFPGISKPLKNESAEEIPLKEQQERKQHILDHRKKRMAISEDKEVGSYELDKREKVNEFENKFLPAKSIREAEKYANQFIGNG